MADKRCENGHFIDESWDLCPYCPPVSRTGDIPVIRPRRVEDEYQHRKTEDDSARRRALTDSQRERLLRAVEPPPPDSLDGVQRTVAVPKADPAGSVAVVPRFVVGWLLALSGPARGEAYPVRMGKNVIGRDRRCDVMVIDEQASAHHADLVFRPEEKRFILMDHNSTNGTFVNGAEIEPRKDLAHKDVIRVGLQKFLFLSLFSLGFSWDDPESMK